MACLESIFLVVLRIFIMIISPVVFRIENGTISPGILYVRCIFNDSFVVGIFLYIY